MDGFSDVDVRPLLRGKPIDFGTEANQCRDADGGGIGLTVASGEPDEFSEKSGTGLHGKGRPGFQREVFRFLRSEVVGCGLPRGFHQ